VKILRTFAASLRAAVSNEAPGPTTLPAQPDRAWPRTTGETRQRVRTARLPDGDGSAPSGLGLRHLKRKLASRLFAAPQSSALAVRKAASANARQFNFALETPFRQPVDWSVCMRGSVDWAACRLVGAPFAFERMDLNEAVSQQAGYEAAFHASLDAMKREIDRQGATVTPRARHRMLVRAVMETTQRHIRGWVASFRDAGGGKHAGRVVVGPPQCSVNLGELLRNSRLGPGDALIISIDKPGDGGGGHTVAMQGGDQPHLFDTALGELRYRGADFASDVEGYLTATHAPRGQGALEYHVIALRVAPVTR